MRKVVGSATTSVVPDGPLFLTGWGLMGLIVCITSLCVVGLFWETVRSMMDVWASSRTFAQGFLVLPATGYLIWSYRHLWMQLVPAPSAWGVAALILLGSGWFVGYVTDVRFAGNVSRRFLVITRPVDSFPSILSANSPPSEDGLFSSSL
jgi:hypothetical protein